MLPNIAEAKKVAAFNPEDGMTVGCKSCKKPLWHIVPKDRYGDRWAARTTSYPDVPPYSEYWSNDQKTAYKLTCPLCLEPYFTAVRKGDQMAAVFYTI